MIGGAGGVVLLHGHGRRAASLRRMAAAFEANGFATLLASYRYRRSLPAIVDELAPRIAAFAGRIGTPIHLVTHSLGGLVARVLLGRVGGPPIGRVVMLGPPNLGSEWADLLFRLRLDSLVLGHVGASLRSKPAPGEMLGDKARDIGIIAGSRALDPIFPRLLLPRPNDGKVSVAATRLDGAHHLVLHVSHTLMVYDRAVIRQAIAFVEKGRFDDPVYARGWTMISAGDIM